MSLFLGVDLPAFVEALEHAWQQIRHIVRDQTWSESHGKLTVNPNRGCSRVERRHSLGEQTCNEAGQNVAASCGRKPRGSILTHRCQTVGCRTNSIGAFQDNDGARNFSGPARTLKL